MCQHNLFQTAGAEMGSAAHLSCCLVSRLDPVPISSEHGAARVCVCVCNWVDCRSTEHQQRTSLCCQMSPTRDTDHKSTTHKQEVDLQASRRRRVTRVCVLTSPQWPS